MTVDSYEEDLDGEDLHLSGPTDGALKRVVELSREQIARERVVAKLRAELAAAEKSLSDIAERELPLLLRDIGVGKLPLVNQKTGERVGTVELRVKTVASVRVEHRPEAFAWLHKHGYGSIVKRKVTAEFGRGDAKKAGKLLGYLTRWYKDFRVSDDEAVHGGTLNAWAKEFVAQQKLAMERGERVLELPDAIKLTDLLTSVVTVNQG